jgi:hypothetical protein
LVLELLLLSFPQGTSGFAKSALMKSTCRRLKPGGNVDQEHKCITYKPGCVGRGGRLKILDSMLLQSSQKIKSDKIFTFTFSFSTNPPCI